MAETNSDARVVGTFPSAQLTIDISARERMVFFACLAAATVFPIVFSLLFDQGAQNKPVDNIFSLLLILSTMHVALTGYFFVDSDYREHMAKNRAYFYGLPVALVLGCGLATQIFGKAGEIHILVFYHAWLLWHYGRQNLGLLSFVAASPNGGGRVRTLERSVLNLAAVGGILGAYGVLGQFEQTVFGGWEQQICNVGLAIYSLAIAGGCINLASLVRDGAPGTRLFFAAILPLFFAPTYLFDSYFEAVMGYAIAHACQYFVFMYYLAAGGRDRSRSNVVLLVTVALFGWILIWITRESSMWGALSAFVPGAAIAIVMWHFVVDAGVWRLRDPWQRSQIRERFEFVFSRSD